MQKLKIVYLLAERMELNMASIIFTINIKLT
jgi:hypothetical protein